jgi:2-dehydropantoate 2-reductase
VGHWFVGAGAIGSVIIGRLPSSSDITVIDSWPENIAAINRDGLIVDYPDQVVRTRVKAVHIFELDRIREQPETVFLAVKSYQTRQICELLAPHLRTEVPIVSLQNCLNEDTIGEVLGQQRTIGAVCEFNAALIGPGHARMLRENRLLVGELDGSITSRLRGIRDYLSESVPTDISNDIWGALWSKLIANSMRNGISALSGTPLAELMSDARTPQLCLGLGAEGVRVADRLGIRLDPQVLYGHDSAAYLAKPGSVVWQSVAESIRRDHAGHPNTRGSMLQDVLGRRPTEVEQMNGAIAARAAELGIDAPLNRAVVRAVKEVEVGTVNPSRAALESVFGEMATEHARHG